LQQFRRIGEALVELCQRIDNMFEPRPFTAKFLCTRRVIPDIRGFEFAGYFVKTLVFDIEVKDTPSGPHCALACL